MMRATFTNVIPCDLIFYNLVLLYNRSNFGFKCSKLVMSEH